MRTDEARLPQGIELTGAELLTLDDLAERLLNVDDGGQTNDPFTFKWALLRDLARFYIEHRDGRIGDA